MTSNQVSNSAGAGLAAWMNSAQFTGKVEKADFSSFMEATEKKMPAEEVKTPQKLKSSDDRNAALKKAEAAKEPEKEISAKPEEKTSSIEKADSREPNDMEVGTLKSAVEGIAKEYEEAFKVTEEELIDALNSLGFNLMALLNPENAAAIAIELTGAEGTISLVTDENLYKMIGDLEAKVNEAVKGLTDKLNVVPEEFLSVINEAAKELPAKEVTADEPKLIENVSDKGIEVRTNLNTEVKDEENAEVKDEPTVEVKNFSIHNNAQTENKNSDLTGSDESEEIVERPAADHIERPEAATFMEQLVERTKEVLNTSEVDVNYSTEQTQAIIDQITERIKVETTPETTEISLRLHPESLGNVSVRISANHEGALTAQFTAQNESVKAVIESQAIVLREALEAKGVSVEAVEVMVGSHEFERNLSDGERRNEQSGQRRSSVRRINLDTPEEETELNEEDVIQKDMMARNGNTIDYTA